MQRERIRDEAAAWVVRLSDSSSEDDHRAFEAWRAQGVEHEIAYERALAAWERLDRAGAFGGGSVPDPDLLASAARAPRPARVWSRLGAVAATLLLALGVGSTILWSLTPSEAYATAVGERRTVRLPDGSTIELNTDTQVIVRYRLGARAIELVRGEAMFHVVKDSRPFAITTSSGRIEAQAADVSVRARDDRADVTVKDGAVLAESSDASAAGGRTALGPDTEASLTPAGAAVQAVAPDEVARRLAWQHGEIAFNGQTLAEAVAEFNRYNVRKITVADRATGALRVGGYFQTADVDGFVAAVTRTFPVVVSAQSEAAIRLARKS